MICVSVSPTIVFLPCSETVVPHSQTVPVAGGSQEERAKRTRGDEIEHEIKKLRDLYGQKQGRVAKPIPFNEVDAVFQKIGEVTRLVRVNDACKRVKEIVKGIKKVASKINDR